MVVLWHFNLTRFHCGCYQHAACCLLCVALALGFKYLQSSCGKSLTAAAWHWVLILVVTWGWSVAETKESSLAVAPNCGKKDYWVKCAFVMDTRLITWNEMKIHLSLSRSCLDFEAWSANPKKPFKNRSCVYYYTSRYISTQLMANELISTLSKRFLYLCCTALVARIGHIWPKKAEVHFNIRQLRFFPNYSHRKSKSHQNINWTSGSALKIATNVGIASFKITPCKRSLCKERRLAC